MVKFTVYDLSMATVRTITLLSPTLSRQIVQQDMMPRRNTKKTNEEFIREARAVHGDNYDYTACHYAGAHKKLTVICRVHGRFDISANSHLRGARLHAVQRRWKAVGQRILRTRPEQYMAGATNTDRTQA